MTPLPNALEHCTKEKPHSNIRADFSGSNATSIRRQGRKTRSDCKEAMVEEKSALTILREVEAKATSEELSRAVRELELDEREAEDELKQQLHTEAARSVTIAVDACTSKYKRAQQEATTRATEALRQALQVAGEDEVARTKAVLGREARMLDERRFSLIAAVEEGLSSCSLRNLAAAESSRSTLSPSMLSPRNAGTRPWKRDNNNTNNNGSSKGDTGKAVERGGGGGGGGGVLSEDDDDADDNDDDDGVASPTVRNAASAVRRVERTAAAAEREYARRARGLVRSKAAAVLRERQRDKSTGSDYFAVGRPREHPVEREKEAVVEGGGDSGVVVCGGCAVLFEANEKLLQEARARGFFVG
ncbi:unnamed protein product [Pylaiella littoralis]